MLLCGERVFITKFVWKMTDLDTKMKFTLQCKEVS